jgi:hypothetical protein
MYDLSTSKETQITGNNSTQLNPVLSGDSTGSPGSWIWSFGDGTCSNQKTNKGLENRDSLWITGQEKRYV